MNHAVAIYYGDGSVDADSDASWPTERRKDPTENIFGIRRRNDVDVAFLAYYSDRAVCADIKNLRADLNGLRGEFNGLCGEFNGLRGEFNEFRSDMNRRFDEVLATQKEHGERLSRLETLVAVLMGQFRSGATDPETGEQAMLAYRARRPDEA